MAVPSIFFGTIDAVANEQMIAAAYTALTGITPAPGDPEFQINATIAYVYTLTQEAIERAGKANLIQFAMGANLDYIAAIIGVRRLPKSASVVQIQFTLVGGHAQVIIPGGTLLSSSDGLAVYATNEDTLVLVGQNTVIVDCTCTTLGIASNGYNIGTINVIQNPQPYLQSATNVNITTGGADVETDAAFVERWYIALEALSVAGPLGAYTFLAVSSNPTINSVVSMGPEEPIIPTIDPGTVEIRVLTNSGIPTQAILDGVYNACNPNTKRPCCDTVLVYGAIPVSYSLVIGVVAFIGANVAALPALVQAAILGYTNTQRSSIGNDVVGDAIINAGMLDGVKRLDLNGFVDISIDRRHVAILNTITVTVIAVEAP